MITFEVLTLFPEIFPSVLGASLLGKAIEKGLLAVHLTDPRDFSVGKHRSVDDAPYGGGGGMVMRPEPIAQAIAAVEGARGPARKVLLCPSGRPLAQPEVVRLAREQRLLFVCGRYEGFDERIRSLVDEEISLGDYVLSGGELGALVLIDAIARRIPGVLGNAESPFDESFEHGLLEYPHYTRPPDFRGLPVPEALLSGDHARVRLWRRREALRRTRERRPDLFSRLPLSDKDRALLDGKEP
ncbi:MAG: tRNA (guanosine(37)-N1)-methyltransferase TrmD [Myxococcales bacterium]|nr:tRNA (guanosine(37)-N1)-methyltransferase TrmD [Myxococcales bacterium]